MAKPSAQASTQRKAVPEIIDLPAVNEDALFVERVSVGVREFLGELSKFFTKATELELAAKATLAEARTLTAPTSMDADARIQTFVKRTTAEKKAVLDHWTICQVVSGFHKRLTAARGRSELALEEANTIANRLHNGWTDAERRRAAEQQERVRREAEQRAREDRERELAQMEAEATAREEASGDLSEREDLFVAAYTATIGATAGNGQESARRAGFKDPFKAAARLLSLPKIQQAIKARQEAAALRQQAEARREQPLDVQVEVVKPQIAKTEGHDRVTHGYEILDEALFIEAFRSGRYGVPTNCVQAAPKGLGELARSLQERLNTIPGVRYVRTTKVV